MTEIIEKINKLQKAIDSPATPDNMKSAMKAQLEKLQIQAEQTKDAELEHEYETKSELELLKEDLRKAEKLMRNPNFTGDVSDDINRIKAKIEKLEAVEKLKEPEHFVTRHEVTLSNGETTYTDDTGYESLTSIEKNHNARVMKIDGKPTIGSEMGTMPGVEQNIKIADEIDSNFDKNTGKFIEPETESASKILTYFKGIEYKYENQFLLNKAIEEFLDEATEGYDFTADERIFMSRYSGMGGLQKYGAKGKGLLYEYYTPEEIIKKMWALAYKHGYSGGNVVESSCGVGRFIKYAPDESRVTGYEINKYSARIAKELYPLATIHVQGFEETFIKKKLSIKNKINDLPKYELNIGNPPYGELQGFGFGMGEKDYTHAGNFIEYFIFRGLDLLIPGGLLIFIVGAELKNGGNLFLSSGKNKCKIAIAEKAELIDAYRLPHGLFNNTDVTTEIVCLRKK